jgi:copper transport protein
MTRTLRRLLVGTTAAAIALVAVSVASAHSVLIATEPVADVVVDASPSRVLLRFDEPVDTGLGEALQVFDGSAQRVDAGRIERPTPREVVVPIDEELPDGTYTVAWRAISADSDPISGAFVFHVGERGANPAGVVPNVLDDSPPAVDVLFTGGRFFEFAFLLLCAGGVAALVFALRSADERVHRRLYGVLTACGGALAFWSLLGIPLQGAKAAGTGLAEGFTWDTISSVVGTRYGKVELIRAGLAVGLLAVALVLRRATGATRETANAAAAVLAAGLVATPPFAGHASTAGTLSVVADVAHVLAAAMWVGGLGFVVIALWLALEQRWPLATRAVPRFSMMAVVSVGVLLVAGTVNGYLQIRSWRGLWDTDYGLLLLAKIALVIPLLGLGAYNNKYAVPRLRAGVAQPGERRRFLQTAGVELGIMATIIAVTAVLVNANPARHALTEEAAAAAGHGHTPSGGGPVHAEVDFGEFAGMVMVEPGTPGANTITLQLDHSKPNVPDLAEVTFSATLAEPAVGPIVAEATQTVHGTWVAEDVQLTLPGSWDLRIEARVGEFDLFTENIQVQIGGTPE